MGIFFPFIIFYLTSTLSFSSAGKSTELATEVCKNTTNFAFCHDVIYSDPRAPDADRNVLSYIIFGQTYTNATETDKYITSTLKSLNSSSSGKIYEGLKKCKGYYSEAIRALSEALNNLDSETYYGLDKLAVDVDVQARACESSFHGHSPMSNKNGDLIKLSNICLVVSKLYTYH